VLVLVDRGRGWAAGDSGERQGTGSGARAARVAEPAPVPTGGEAR
jgi:hypothetical protein